MAWRAMLVILIAAKATVTNNHMAVLLASYLKESI